MNDLIYANTAIREREDMLCLTDMWKAANGGPKQHPSRWTKTNQAIGLMAEIGKHVPQGTNLVQRRGGRGGGVYAHWQLALAYAQYLSPAFHAWCNSVVRAHMEGKPAPDPMWQVTRQEARVQRGVFTSELSQRGVTKRQDYARATNAGYVGLFGLPAKRLRTKLGVGEKANVRDHLTRTDLAQVLLAECLAIETMEEERSWGADECIDATSMAARSVARAVQDNRSNRRALR